MNRGIQWIFYKKIICARKTEDFILKKLCLTNMEQSCVLFITGSRTNIFFKMIMYRNALLWVAIEMHCHLHSPLSSLSPTITHMKIVVQDDDEFQCLIPHRMMTNFSTTQVFNKVYCTHNSIRFTGNLTDSDIDHTIQYPDVWEDDGLPNQKIIYLLDLTQDNDKLHGLKIADLMIKMTKYFIVLITANDDMSTEMKSNKTRPWSTCPKQDSRDIAPINEACFFICSKQELNTRLNKLFNSRIFPEAN